MSLVAACCGWRRVWLVVWHRFPIMLCCLTLWMLHLSKSPPKLAAPGRFYPLPGGPISSCSSALRARLWYWAPPLVSLLRHRISGAVNSQTEKNRSLFSFFGYSRHACNETLTLVRDCISVFFLVPALKWTRALLLFLLKIKMVSILKFISGIPSSPLQEKKKRLTIKKLNQSLQSLLHS